MTYPGSQSDEHSYEYGGRRSTRSGKDSAKMWMIAASLCGFVGAIFSGISTADFINHLDRQVHSIHCSFIPGAAAEIGESGCRTVMMSPYSSLFRESLWGGMPISLLAFAVFFYLAARTLSFALRDARTKNESAYLLLAWTLPVLMSVVYGVISVTQIGELCTVCMGVYVASFLGFVFSFVANLKAAPAQKNFGSWASWFGMGVLYVGLLALLFLVFSPKDKNPAEGCGTLTKTDDKNGIILETGLNKNGAEAIAVLDPLCPACKGFDERLQKSGLSARLNMKTVLFPLDAECNWMVADSLHPGACAVSEAMLCRPDDAEEILLWAFQNQEDLKAKAKKNSKPVRALLKKRFPKVKGCLGTSKIKNKLNKSLRWAVANALPVLTPQLFIQGSRVCDEDTDLGLEFTVSEMLKSKAGAK